MKKILVLKNYFSREWKKETKPSTFALRRSKVEALPKTLQLRKLIIQIGLNPYCKNINNNLYLLLRKGLNGNFSKFKINWDHQYVTKRLESQISMDKTFCEIAKGKPIKAVIGRSEFNSFLESFRSTGFVLNDRRYRAKLDVVSQLEIS